MMLLEGARNSRWLQGCQWLAALALVASCFATTNACADDAIVTKVAGGLDNPSSVAVRPESGISHEVFVAERGAGRVVKIGGDAAKAADTKTEAIAGFLATAQSDNPKSSSGLQSLF